MDKYMSLSFIKRTCTGFLFLCLSSLLFSGCAATSSGNLLGEATVLKYSTDQKKYHYVDAAMIVAGAGENDTISSPHYTVPVVGRSLNMNINVFSFDYAIHGQKGGLFLSVPVSLPMDIGVRPSFVQWVGPVYFGAGVSFVGGYYANQQNKNYEPKVENPEGRFDGFILYNIGAGAMFDISEEFSLGAYANFDRIAFNSAGTTEKDYSVMELYLLDDIRGRENLPPYAKRKNVVALGISAFWNSVNPKGFYIEYAPKKFLYKDGRSMLRIGTIWLY